MILSGRVEAWESLASMLLEYSAEALCCGCMKSARESNDRHEELQLVLCDDVLPDGGLRDAVAEFSAEHGIPVVAMSDHDDWDSYLTAMNAGAFDYIVAPPTRDELQRLLGLTTGGVRFAQPHAA